LSKANLAFTDLSDANLSESNLQGANLTGANLTNIIMPNGKTVDLFDELEKFTGMSDEEKQER